MSKVFTFVILSVGMMLLMNTMGIPTAVTDILAWLGLSNPNQAVSTSLFFAAITAIFAAGSATGIIIGLITRSSPETYIAAGFVTLLAVFVGTFTSVINTAAVQNDWTSTIILLIMAPIAIGYGVALISFWRGSD